MINNQATSVPSRPPSRTVAGITLRVARCFFAAFFLNGCSTPQPIPSNEAPPSGIAVISAPPAENIGPAVAELQTIAPVPEENNVFFSLRSATVVDTEKEKLRQHADRLKLNRKQKILLVGHSDDQGSRNYNLAINEERLSAVQKLLRTYGVSASQIRRNRSGSVNPRTPCAACQQQMRRVELVYLP